MLATVTVICMLVFTILLAMVSIPENMNLLKLLLNSESFLSSTLHPNDSAAALSTAELGTPLTLRQPWSSVVPLHPLLQASIAVCFVSSLQNLPPGLPPGAQGPWLSPQSS